MLLSGHLTCAGCLVMVWGEMRGRGNSDVTGGATRSPTMMCSVGARKVCRRSYNVCEDVWDVLSRAS